MDHSLGGEVQTLAGRREKEGKLRLDMVGSLCYSMSSVNKEERRNKNGLTSINYLTTLN